MNKLKDPLTQHEEFTITQIKALLKQWPKGLAMEFDGITPLNPR